MRNESCFISYVDMLSGYVLVYSKTNYQHLIYVRNKHEIATRSKNKGMS